MYGPFEDMRKKGMWWSSTVNNEMTSMSVYIFSDAVNLLRPSMDNKFGLSVRCINDLPLLTDYDKNYYKTVKIGDQVWMAENLRTTRFNDGTPIPLLADFTEWINCKSPAYCWYDNDENTYSTTYGALYNWYAVNTGKLCPTGWHVPSDDEWTTLTDYLGGESVAGNKLIETGTIHWKSPDTGATNETGFTALPGGFRGCNENQEFVSIGDNGFWWSSSGRDASQDWERSGSDRYNGWSRRMEYNNRGVSREDVYPGFGYSVRCVKD
jgi:uncharacterized protein (TIGR02145 family)